MYPRSVPYENSPPRRDNILTVTMPGLTSPRAQIARYTGADGVTVLQNWADGYEPLHDVDAHKNRNTKRCIGAVAKDGVRCALTKMVAVDDDPNASSARASADTAAFVTHHHTDSFASICDPLLSRADNQDELNAERRRRAEAADLGLIDPPVLYRASCHLAPRLLHNVMPSPEVSECVHTGWYWTLNPVHWGLVIKELFTNFWFATRPFQLCYSEPGRTNLGGSRDQAVFIREVRRAVRELIIANNEQSSSSVPRGRGPSTPGKRHLVLFGCSRGATTCFYSAMKLSPELASHVSLVIVEAPFDTLESVISTSSWLPRINMWFFKTFCDYEGTETSKKAYSYDPSKVYIRCPVAFVMSVKDRRVPNACTQKLIDSVRAQLVPERIPAVEVLVLKHSRHPCMSLGHKEDQDAYVAFVERLYDTYCP